MFPLVPNLTLTRFAEETHNGLTRKTKPSSRVDIHRQQLEYKKMHHIDVLTLDLRERDLEQKLDRKRMVMEARGSQVSFTSRFRKSIGSTLISIGERIRPESATSDPTFNA